MKKSLFLALTLSLTSIPAFAAQQTLLKPGRLTLKNCTMNGKKDSMASFSSVDISIETEKERKENSVYSYYPADEVRGTYINLHNNLATYATQMESGISVASIGIGARYELADDNSMRIYSYGNTYGACRSEFAKPVETEKYLIYKLKCGDTIKDPIEMSQVLVIDKESKLIVYNSTKRRDARFSTDYKYLAGISIPAIHLMKSDIGELTCQDKNFDIKNLVPVEDRNIASTNNEAIHDNKRSQKEVIENNSKDFEAPSYGNIAK